MHFWRCNRWWLNFNWGIFAEVRIAACGRWNTTRVFKYRAWMLLLHRNILGRWVIQYLMLSKVFARLQGLVQLIIPLKCINSVLILVPFPPVFSRIASVWHGRYPWLKSRIKTASLSRMWISRLSWFPSPEDLIEGSKLAFIFFWAAQEGLST